MRKQAGRTAAAIAGALALGIGSAVWAASSAAAAPTGPAAIGRCAASDLAVWVNADSENGTAGTTFFNLDYTNTGRVTCFLGGYPGVSATTAEGVQLGKAARRNSATPARVIDLAAGATAHSFLGYVDIVVDPTCKPKTAFYLKVYAPGDTVAKHAFFPFSVCTTGPVDLVVQRVQSGV